MRSEQQMLDLILKVAHDDERIRAVIMNGSRVNPTVTRDIFQDYDIVYVVSSLDELVRERDWLHTFGDLIIQQTPDDMGVPPSANEKFAFLMLFTDGNRIDLTLYRVNQLHQMKSDSLSLLLLDKDHIIEPLAPPCNQDYLTVPPTAKQYADCCNEFWWVSTYIAKGLWRRELAYAKYMYDRPVRDVLNLMLEWYIGIQTDFSVDPGKCGKYFEKYLEPRHWTAYVRTYPDADYEHIWNALFIMCDLFRETAMSIANHFAYDYPSDDDRRVTNYLQHVRAFPRDAAGVY